MDELRAKGIGRELFLTCVDYQYYLVTHAFAVDMAHKQSEMGKKFDAKGTKRIQVIYMAFKKKLEAKYGPQKEKGVCVGDEQFRNINVPVFC